jgi:hypothetical protein
MICVVCAAAPFKFNLLRGGGAPPKFMLAVAAIVPSKLRVKFLDPRRGLWREVAGIRVKRVEGLMARDPRHRGSRAYGVLLFV